ncbi:nuclear protein DGCR14 [Aspergillus pseudonomiae]|uniref:Nuclear protein DGCR14 n=1 Tax=Aspergillus pseudonomiae TaxID=1506151 RepID=A0A5N6HMT0_9EURO|nr:nuclear protein DGCR14 [Aspergillus pseudonomiae]KAB8254033.1 nuclear protein DGCR14 [Aspergillus pseudonomiae]KAE8399797.1 nuclear protein DGCR14 [Aspergillus pseudonomiae]
MSSSSQALAKRHIETSLMPPPPPKRIKRPTTVLDEDVYTNTLSGIIARDYFPGLLEMQVKQEYLEALDSRDEEWIATSKRRLTDLMLTPERARNRSEPSDPVITTNRTEIRHVGDTPTGWGGDTPMSVMSMASSSPAQHLKDNHSSNLSNLGLLEFQAKYTSEDNESFNKLLDKQNTKRREKYAWIWSGNKIPSARQIAHHQREAKRVEEQGLNPYQDKQLATKKDFDSRPAKPDSWKARSENSLMFTPSSVEDTLETLQQKAEASSRAGPKRVVYQNTRLPDEGLKSTQDGGALPPSPSISAIKDAIAGRPRPSDSEAGYSGSETPRVNGYAFVDEDEPDYPTNNVSKDSHAGFLEDLRLLGTSDKTPNPFKIRENRRREDLHHRVVDRVARKKRAEKVAQETKSPVAMTPRFASSLRLDFGLRMPGRAIVGGSGPSKLLTPAAQKLLHRMGNTPRPTESSSSNLKNVWTPTPRRAK